MSNNSPEVDAVVHENKRCYAELGIKLGYPGPGVHQQTVGILQIKRAEGKRKSPGSWISTEVDQLDSSLGRQENVVAFDVTVDDLVVVQMLETL